MATVTVLAIAGIVVLGVVFVIARRPGRRRTSLAYRFGHAFPNPWEKDDPKAPKNPDPVFEAFAIAAGDTTIGPRPPTNRVVYDAERELGILRTRRPVYAYVGCLHPHLGTIGVVIKREWFGVDAHGVTRCDTGGLIGRIKGFSHGPAGGELRAIKTLTHKPAKWEPAMDRELETAHGGWEPYVRGRVPETKSLDSYRRICVETERSAGRSPDRRLWTWEARVFADIAAKDIRAIVMTEEATKKFEALRDARPRAVPDSIEAVPCAEDPVTVDGVTKLLCHFDEDRVVELFTETA